VASISREPNGHRTIQFVGADARRRSIRLGKVSQRVAEAVKVRVEQLAAASIARHSLDDETARWVADLDLVMAAKLAAVGLIPRREAITLKRFLDTYVDNRTDVKPDTKVIWRHTCRNLVDYFGPSKPLREITEGDADDWRVYLATEGLGEDTIRRRCGLAKQFFGAAVRKKLATSNPFSHLAATVRGNKAKFHFVTRDDAKAILDACPDLEWRLIFALSRYAGLRCPSEHVALRWVDVDWARGRMVIHSPKTKHHPGGAERQTPIFPELLPYLREAFEHAKPGTEFVITRYRHSNQNLRTQFDKIVRRAGLKPWPKPFQNLRSTRETELAETWPVHVVCAWLGNTPKVAAKHYLQVTEDHFEGAAMPTQPVENPVQNPVQQPAVSARTDSQPEEASHEIPNDYATIREGASECETSDMGGNGRGWIRTSEGISQRIYSPLPLATWVHALVVRLPDRRSL